MILFTAFGSTLFVVTLAAPVYVTVGKPNNPMRGDYMVVKQESNTA